MSDSLNNMNIVIDLHITRAHYFLTENEFARIDSIYREKKILQLDSLNLFSKVSKFLIPFSTKENAN